MARSSYTSRIPGILRDWERRVERANERTADAIADRARPNVPRLTGRTAGTIEVGPAEEGGQQVSTDFPGSMVEWGAAHSPARPFLTPAAEAEREGHARRIKDALS